MRSIGATAPADIPAGEVPGPLPRRHVVFAVVALALFMASMDQTIVATGLNAIQSDLGAELTWSGWTITIYSLGQIIAMPMAGKLGDHFGRKKVFLIAVVVFTAASLACGFANNIYVLVALRAVQALGGGAFMPAATGIIADHYGPARDRAVGMFTSIFPIGGILGPILGGVFVTYSSWRTIFFVNVPIGVVLFVLAWRLIGETPRKRADRIDVRGLVLLASLMLTTMYGLTNLDHGLTSPWFLVPVVGGALFSYLFARHTARSSAPFIPMRFLRGKGFGAMNVLNLLFGGAAIGFGALVPLYAEERFHLDPLAAGTVLTARGAGVIAVAALAVLTLRRLGCRIPMVVGFVLITTGFALMAFPPPNTNGYLWLMMAAGITGVGMGVSVPASNNVGLQLAPDQISSIAGLRGMFRQSGSIIAVSVMTAVAANSANPALAQAHGFVVLSVLLLAAVPLIFTIPDHRGSW
ncbi:MFS transporter [Actinophytocola algeriensis]|uniref:EmrB/QacA subfamily drug resistance transporter n=1 Tax=Actinophytocola algeriensis TaxID=1768010 RepID=A0A7W7PZF7_9PSEU|nr:MFS transporter [Actinophytocola algeriensis]MBB4904149.1 EmrB/QacA subfamily drug resistance transporter [Actinophytocola algeriensis]MBE1476994.1 EmrB/QacA subfamily drug resistance transporter [Actinophytocola algeriensis]